MFQESEKATQEMSAAVASQYVRRMVEMETRGFGDTDGAMRRLEARFGLPFWSLWHLRQGRAKTIEASLLSRIRGAYLSYCEHQVASLQHEIAIEKALTGDDLQDLVAEADALAKKIAQAKAARIAKRGRE